MKTFTILFGITLLAVFSSYGQANVTFAAPAGYKLKVVIGSQTQEEDQYVRFEKLDSGAHTARITATTGTETYNLQSNISLPDRTETSYFVIVVNKTAQIHWSNESALPVALQPTANRDNRPYAGNSMNANPRNQNAYRQPGESTNRGGQGQHLPGRTNPVRTVTCNCTNPYPVMTPLEALRLKATVQQASFDDNKIAIIQTALVRANIMSEDVRDLMRLLRFDNNRLKLAKRAYERTCDTQNYSLVAAAFDFPSNARELQRYLQYRR